MAADNPKLALADPCVPGSHDTCAAVPSLSVVVPAYNEAGNIAAALQDVVEHVLAEVPDAEVVVVDHSSRDATADIVRHSAASDQRIRLVR